MIQTSISGLDSTTTEERVLSKADSPIENNVPFHQTAALLHAPRQSFVLMPNYPIPYQENADELVVEIRAIGLNPVDWKSVDYNFAIPQLPYIAGRDFAGIVVQAPTSPSRLRVGDVVLSPSTDYRDIRKSAFQEYAIANEYNVARIPTNVGITQGASIGVAFVAAAHALGVSLGLELPAVSDQGPIDLWKMVRGLPRDTIPVDIVDECLSGIEQVERPEQGDWIAIYGGSSTSALFISGIAQLAGLKVILLADVAKHGSQLGIRAGSVLVDNHDPTRAINIVRSITKGGVRFAIDTVGKETAGHLVKMLRVEKGKRAHLVGLTGVPKERVDGILYHSIPIKLFHEVPCIGRTLMEWLEKALETEAIALPEVERAGGGLGGINAALDRMRSGEISGRRLVISQHG